jgi:hypothetical protein
MEPRKDRSKKIVEAGKERKKGRFQIIRLEERIAPSHIGHGRCPRPFRDGRYCSF